MINKAKTLLLLLIMIPAGLALAQTNTKGVEWMLKEKIKISPEEAVRVAREGNQEQPDKSEKGTTQYTDVPIVTSTSIDAEVHAAINPADTQNLIASPIRQTSASISVPIYYTKNFGGTWNKSAFNPMPAAPGAQAIGGGDPVIAFDQNGKAYYSWLELHIKNMSTDTIYWGLYWAWSNDGGVTWTRPQSSAVAFSKVLTATFSSDRPVTDKQWMAVDKTQGSFKNNLYMSYVEIDMAVNTYTIVVHTKPADSASFNPASVSITDSSFTLCQFASLDVDYQGKVHVTFFGTRNNTDYGLYHSVSADGGVTFSPPALISPIQIPRFSAGQINGTVPGISDNRLYPACYVAANPLSQNLYITWTANGVTSMQNQGLDIYFSTSNDGGLTWSAPKVVNDNQDTLGTHQYYSSIACGKDGNLILGWYDRRGDTANLEAHYFFSESFDHGNTFSPAYQVTTLGTNFAKVGLLNDDFGIGEYTQILGLKDYIIPVWTDGRTNNGDLNIYVAFINRKTMQVEQLGGVNQNLGITAIYPNPAKDFVKISFSLGSPSSLEIILFDQTGRKVSYSKYPQFGKGEHEVGFDPGNIPGGTYYLSVRAGSDHLTRMLTVIR